VLARCLRVLVNGLASGNPAARQLVGPCDHLPMHSADGLGYSSPLPSAVGPPAIAPIQRPNRVRHQTTGLAASSNVTALRVTKNRQGKKPASCRALYRLDRPQKLGMMVGQTTTPVPLSYFLAAAEGGFLARAPLPSPLPTLPPPGAAAEDPPPPPVSPGVSTTPSLARRRAVSSSLRSRTVR
jgi:hypothetical protein